MTELDVQSREVLQARAKELARRRRVEERQSTGEFVAVFEIAGERMALPVFSLKSVVRVPNITRVSGQKPWIAGLIQVQGNVISVIDLTRWLGLTGRARGHYLALLEHKHRSLGLLVDGVAGVREIFSDEIVVKQVSNVVGGALPVRWTTRDLVSVLDVARLFELADQRNRVAASESTRLPSESSHE